MDNTTERLAQPTSTELIQQAIDKIRPSHGKKQDGAVFLSKETAEAIELLELAIAMIDVERAAEFDRGFDQGSFRY